MNPKTYSAKASELDHHWYVIDADGMVLGRLASQAAQILRGKHKPTFTPHMNGGDFVVVVNAAKVAVTRNRLDSKMYYRHSQYPGGLKSETLRQLLARKPERAIELAIEGMLPHNRLGDDIMGHLKVYAGPTHPHQAQKPIPWQAPKAEPVEAATSLAVSAEQAADTSAKKSASKITDKTTDEDAEADTAAATTEA
jgi:large subunit ribosomal protein L13